MYHKEYTPRAPPIDRPRARNPRKTPARRAVTYKGPARKPPETPESRRAVGACAGSAEETVGNQVSAPLGNLILKKYLTREAVSILLGML